MLLWHFERTLDDPTTPPWTCHLPKNNAWTGPTFQMQRARAIRVPAVWTRAKSSNSCTNCGQVNSEGPRSKRYPFSLRSRSFPPGSSAASKSRTRCPFAANRMAAARPATPAPTTMAWCVLFKVMRSVGAPPICPSLAGNKSGTKR